MFHKLGREFSNLIEHVRRVNITPSAGWIGCLKHKIPFVPDILECCEDFTPLERTV